MPLPTTPIALPTAYNHWKPVEISRTFAYVDPHPTVIDVPVEPNLIAVRKREVKQALVEPHPIPPEHWWHTNLGVEAHTHPNVNRTAPKVDVALSGVGEFAHLDGARWYGAKGFQ